MLTECAWETSPCMHSHTATVSITCDNQVCLYTSLRWREERTPHANDVISVTAWRRTKRISRQFVLIVSLLKQLKTNWTWSSLILLWTAHISPSFNLSCYFPLLPVQMIFFFVLKTHFNAKKKKKKRQDLDNMEAGWDCWCVLSEPAQSLSSHQLN